MSWSRHSLVIGGYSEQLDVEKQWIQFWAPVSGSVTFPEIVTI